ncbi:hypothetical protein M422DRAFT_245935 [Sphaerobolus stellatus SS14]|nr:hypothetical protein M422DRAFT_245935 [Sphaerobolus stellatus SS14]
MLQTIMNQNNTLLAMRLYNANADQTTPLRMPPGVEGFPVTKSQLALLRADLYQELAQHLGRPGLPSSATPDERREQIIQFLAASL